MSLRAFIEKVAGRSPATNTFADAAAIRDRAAENCQKIMDILEKRSA
ncbi:hypothetical protein [Desulfobacter sp.]